METLVMLCLWVVAVALYFLPALIAHKRKHHQEGAIAVLNLLLGWTFIGWVGSLVWASSAVVKQPGN
jgi:hypothetical protein